MAKDLFDQEQHEINALAVIQHRRKTIALVASILFVTVVMLLMLLAQPGIVISGLMAYSFGLRHGFDADHITAIDNVTRQLTTATNRPVSVGFFFALGHSSVVLITCIAIIVAMETVEANINSIEGTGGVIGASVSATFLLLVGALNLFSLFKLIRAWRQLAQTKEPEQQVPLSALGGCCSGFFSKIKQPWHMYPLGFLFGLSFDTSTEVALLGMVALNDGVSNRAWIILLPLIFACGMSLVDTLDGAVMSWAYGRASTFARQQIYFNIFLTGASGFIALFIGLIVLLGLIASVEELEGPFWEGIASVNDNSEATGGVVVGIFMLSLLLALLSYRSVFQEAKELAVAVEPESKYAISEMQVSAMAESSHISI